MACEGGGGGEGAERQIGICGNVWHGMSLFLLAIPTVLNTMGRRRRNVIRSKKVRVYQPKKTAAISSAHAPKKSPTIPCAIVSQDQGKKGGKRQDNGFASVPDLCHSWRFRPPPPSPLRLRGTVRYGGGGGLKNLVCPTAAWGRAERASVCPYLALIKYPKVSSSSSVATYGGRGGGTMAQQYCLLT